MTENQSSVASGPAVRFEDPAWAYGRAVPDARNNTQCTFYCKMISIILLGFWVMLKHVKSI